MDHEYFKEQILALYDGELTGSSRREAETHLAACAECRDLYDSWSKAAKVFFKPAAQSSNEFLLHQVMGRIQELESAKPRIKWAAAFGWLVPAAGIAALFLMVLQPGANSLSMDALLTGSEDNLTTALYGQAPATADETLEFVMGG